MQSDKSIFLVINYNKCFVVLFRSICYAEEKIKKTSFQFNSESAPSWDGQYRIGGWGFFVDNIPIQAI